VVIAVNGIPAESLSALVQWLSAMNLPVHLWTGLTGFSYSRLHTIPVAHEPFLVVLPPRQSLPQRAAKRTLDVVVSLALLVLVSPILAVSAALIKLHDRGPALFRQTRIGRYGRPFTVFKLRTMEVDAEARQAELSAHNERKGPLFKLTKDPRVTPIGSILRASAIDELPQLLNVLRGHMSMVGPRPALPAETAEFDDDLHRRHLVRPGVTGLWQVEANEKAAFEEYRRLDLFYVENWSVTFDLAIMFDTLPAIGRRALRALRRQAPSAPVPVASRSSAPQAVEVGR
jgi:lipopolysaccharide/colanic/teichoic acid biosynthesis glycosyltransferase